MGRPRNVPLITPEDFVKDALKKGPMTFDELCQELEMAPTLINRTIRNLRLQKYLIKSDGNKLYLSGQITEGGGREIDLKRFDNTHFKIGFTGDNHLCNEKSRLDVLEALYDRFKEEGVSDVYNTGNWIDGEARFNKHELLVYGMTPQIEYFVEHYPMRDGIVTFFVAGDDHEGWYVQREKINIGEYAELKARQQGRRDLRYMGYMEADVAFQMGDGTAIMKTMHPGGGSAYALSYSPQKLIESFQGGMKPQILLIGHYHKFDFMHYRNVYAVQTGTTSDQTFFMRKKKIAAHLGGGILEFEISSTGAVNRMKCEWFSFFDKKYYATYNFEKRNDNGRKTA